MSSTPTTSANHAAGTSTHRAQAHASRTAGGPQGASGSGDLFSNLLALLSATHDAPTLGSPEAESDDEPTGQGLSLGTVVSDQNPLAGLLGWTGATPHTTALSGSEGLPGSTTPTIRLQTAASGGQSQAEPLGSKADSTTQAHPAPAQGDTNTLGLTLQGMTLLETPTAPDASTLAALGRASTGEATTTSTATAKPKELGSEAASRPAAWRSTVGNTSHTTAQTPPLGLSAGHDKMPIVHQTLVPQTRSTITLDERFALAQTSDAPLAITGAISNAGAGSATGGHSQGGGSGSPGAASEHLSPEAAVERNEQPSAEAAYATHAQEAEEVVEAHWGMPQLRQASLRVGEAGEDAIEIQLAMTGQELNVEFRTDNSEARASLAQEASQSLGDLLERSGIQLGNVSVGAQSQQQGEHGRAPAQAPAQARARTASVGDNTAAAAPVEQRPRSDGSRPLDLFV